MCVNRICKKDEGIDPRNRGNSRNYHCRKRELLIYLLGYGLPGVWPDLHACESMHRRENMKNKRKFLGWMIACFCISVAGCAGAKETENIQKGMEAIEALDYRGAIAYFETAQEQGEDERLIARGLGIASMGLTNYESAIDYFEQCLSYSDGVVQNMDFDVNYYLAAAYCKKNDYRAAEQIYDAILAMQEDSEAYFLRGNARLEQGKTEEAIADFEKVISREPDDYDMLINIYEILEAHEMKEKGLSYLQTALTEREKKMTAYDKGRIYYYMGDFLQACVQLEEAKKLNTADVYYYLGMSYESTGDYSYALNNVYIKYLDHNDGDARIYNQQGLCYLKQGDYEPALQAFQNAMQIPDNGMMQTLQFNEIVAYEYLGEFDSAAALLHNYLQIYPDDAAALREYEFLSTR